MVRGRGKPGPGAGGFAAKIPSVRLSTRGGADHTTVRRRKARSLFRRVLRVINCSLHGLPRHLPRQTSGAQASTLETTDGAGGKFRSKLWAAARQNRANVCADRKKLAPGHRESVAGTPREKLDKEQVGAGDEVVTSGQSAPCSPRCRPGGRHPTHLVSCNQYH